jgi:transcriptional regulator with XRE-family HTH domain
LSFFNFSFSQTSFSFDAGIEMSYFSKIERGEANPSLEIIYAIVKALNIKSQEILPF